jgi:uncharacterized membrane protein
MEQNPDRTPDPTDLGPAGGSVDGSAKPRRPVRPFNLWSRVRAYFLAGVLVTAPLAITFYLAWLFISFVDSHVMPFIPTVWNPETYLPFSVPGIGLIVMFIALTLIGALTAGYVGRLLVRGGERVLGRTPVIRSIYSATKQIVQSVLANQSRAFREVVLVEYPRRGIWTLGFLTGTTEGEVHGQIGDDLLNVFVPTTPNPTGGFLLFVPRRDVIKLSMSVEEGIKMVVSVGIVTPPDRRPPELRRDRIAPPTAIASE